MFKVSPSGLVRQQEREQEEEWKDKEGEAENYKRSLRDE